MTPLNASVALAEPLATVPDVADATTLFCASSTEKATVPSFTAKLPTGVTVALSATEAAP